MRVAYNMFTVIDTYKIGDNLSVTLDGECEQLKNGVTLKDRAGNKYKVLSVGMTHFNNPTDITRSTTVLLMPCSLIKGEKLDFEQTEYTKI